MKSGVGLVPITQANVRPRLTKVVIRTLVLSSDGTNDADLNSLVIGRRLEGGGVRLEFV
jgi:hypothetical protein